MGDGLGDLVVKQLRTAVQDPHFAVKNRNNMQAVWIRFKGLKQTIQCKFRVTPYTFLSCELRKRFWDELKSDSMFQTVWCSSDEHCILVELLSYTKVLLGTGQTHNRE